MITSLNPRAEMALDRFALDPYCKLYLPLYKLDGDSFADRSAYGHLCINHGSTWTPQGRSFDGVDDYVDCGNNASLDITDAITLEVWAKRMSIGEYQRIVSKGTDKTWQIDTASSGRHIRLVVLNPAGAAFIVFTTTAELPTEWTHIVATYNHQIAKVCFNADEAGSQAGTDSIRVTTYKLGIGISDPDDRYYYFNGLISSVLIYSRALTPQEILEHYIVGRELF